MSWLRKSKPQAFTGLVISTLPQSKSKSLVCTCLMVHLSSSEKLTDTEKLSSRPTYRRVHSMVQRLEKICDLGVKLSAFATNTVIQTRGDKIVHTEYFAPSKPIQHL